MKNNDDYLKLKDLENQIEPDEIQENQSSLHDYQWASNIVKKYINQTNTQKFPCYLFQMENGWKVFLEFKFLNEICIFSGQNDTKSKAFQKSMILMAQKIEKHRNTIGLDMGCDYLKPNLFINLDDLQFSQEQLNQINEFYENESFTQQKSQHIQNYENQSQLTTVKSSSQFEKSFKKQFLHKENLPIFQQKNQILQIINQSQVSIIQGEPGCGKSTQVPQFILDNCQNSNVIMTQPRRIACQSIANRIAFERNQKLGDSQVGYQFRDEKILPVKNEQGSLLICTTGTLLQMLRSDISEVTHIILDDFHDRHEDSDILLVLIRHLIKEKLNMKLILMGATICPKKLYQFFQQYDISVSNPLKIDQNCFQVYKYFLGDIIDQIGKQRLKQITDQNELQLILDEQKFNESSVQNIPDEIPIQLILQLLIHITNNLPNGTILIFLPGISDIKELQLYIDKNISQFEQKLQVILLHSKFKDIQQVFQTPPENVRKIIISTNIAESSITIQDAVYVIDSVRQKSKFYYEKKQTNSLKVEWACLSNVKQRIGRLGRVQEGHYYCLISKQRAIQGLNEYTVPVIQRIKLDQLYLMLESFKLSITANQIFKMCLDPPSSEMINLSENNLMMMGAINENLKITKMGQFMSSLQLEPQQSKMLLLAVIFQCVDPILTFLAMNEETTFARNKFDTFYSDHLYMNQIISEFENIQNKHVICDKFQIQYSELQKIIKNKKKIKQVFIKSNLFKENDSLNKNSQNQNLLRFILLQGLYPQISVRKRKNKFMIMNSFEGVIPFHSVNFIKIFEEDQSVCYLVHESLHEEYVKLIKSTAIDPILILIFCTPEYELIRQSDQKLLLIIKNFGINFEGSQVQVNAIIRLQQIYQNFIQFKLEQIINNGFQLKEEIQFFQLIYELIGQSSHFRKPIINNLYI